MEPDSFPLTPGFSDHHPALCSSRGYTAAFTTGVTFSYVMGIGRDSPRPLWELTSLGTKNSLSWVAVRQVEVFGLMGDLRDAGLRQLSVRQLVASIHRPAIPPTDGAASQPQPGEPLLSCSCTPSRQHSA